jgi:hypothetical protein
VTAAVLAGGVALIVLIAVLATGGSADGGLRAEVASPTDLLIYVKEEDNVPGIADGKRAVTVECVDRKGATVVRGHHAWPFSDTDNGTVDPHVHQVVPADRSGDLRRCRLVGTRGPLEGQVAPAA